MLCTPEHVQKCVDMGVDFIVLGGNPGSGTSINDVIACTKWIKEKYGDQLFVFAGKWEDNTTVFIHLCDFIGFHKRTLHSIKAGAVTAILTVRYAS